MFTSSLAFDGVLIGGGLVQNKSSLLKGKFLSNIKVFDCKFQSNRTFLFCMMDNVVSSRSDIHIND